MLGYCTGTRYLATGEGLTIFSSDRDLVRRVWEAHRRGQDAASALIEGLAGGLSALADLVLIEGDTTRAELLVRGDIDVTLRAESGEVVTIAGRGVRTWREHAADGVRSLRVGSDAPPASFLPLQEGMVLADGFRWGAGDLGPGTADDAPPAGAPAEAPANDAMAPQPPGTPAPATPPPPDPAPPAPDTAAPAAPAAAVALAPVASVAPAGSVAPAIDSVPAWPTIAPAPAHSAEETRIGGDEDEFAHLFESTVLRGAEDAAVRIDPDADEEAAESAGGEVLGDHDGATILGSQLSALLGGQRGGASDGAHGSTDGSSASSGQRPTPGLELVFSTGQVVRVDQPVVIGRKPQADRVSGPQLPRLVTVTGPNDDISRSHLEIRPDGDVLLATDLGSTNGTVLVDGSGSRPLAARVAQPVGAGMRLDLGDGVTIDVRAAQ